MDADNTVSSQISNSRSTNFYTTDKNKETIVDCSTSKCIDYNGTEVETGKAIQLYFPLTVEYGSSTELEFDLLDNGSMVYDSSGGDWKA